jgi:hypothetical protein
VHHFGFTTLTSTVLCTKRLFLLLPVLLFPLTYVVTEPLQQGLLEQLTFHRVIKEQTDNPTSEAIPARVALDGNEYLQSLSLSLSSEPKKTETAIVSGTGLCSLILF